MARRRSRRTRIEFPGVGSVGLFYSSSLTPEEIRRWQPVVAVTVGLAESIQRRIRKSKKMASGRPAPTTLEIAGGLWAGAEVRLTRRGRATLAFYRKSFKSGRFPIPELPKDDPRRTWVSRKHKVANRLKGQQAQRYWPEPIFEPSTEEVNAVLAAVAQSFTSSALAGATQAERTRARRDARRSVRGRVDRRLLRRLSGI